MKQSAAGFLLGSLLASTAAQAYAEEQASDVSEVIVTAQRREQSLQEVPLAVTAVSASALERAGAPDTSELVKLTPSLTMTLTNLSVTPYIRGVGSALGSVGTESAVATYVDGVYVQSAQAALFAFNNVERIEVLRGPQGTLFGRNTTGGLIQVVTKNPSHTPSLNAGATYQNYETITGQLYATAGLTETIAASIALAGRSQGEGYSRNTFLNEDVDFQEYAAGRAELSVEPADTVRVNLAYDYQQAAGGYGLNRRPAPGTRFQNGTLAPSDPRLHQGNVPTKSRLWQWGLALKADYDLSENVTLSSIAAYRKNKSHYIYDQDATPTRTVDVDIRQMDASVQQEFFANAEWGGLNLTTGLFYFWTEGQFYPNRTRSATTPASNRENYARLPTKSYAGYFQGTYALTDATNVTAGLRFTREEKEVTGYQVAIEGNTLPVGTIVATASQLTPQTKNFERLTWRFAVDHKFSEDLMAYASVNRGYRSGNYNASSPRQVALEPEILDSYEAGLKSELFDRQLRFNAAGYIYDYKNLQVSRVLINAVQTLNAAKAAARGLEFEAEFRPRLDTGRLSVRSSVGYAWGEYKKFPDGPVAVPNPFTSPPPGVTCRNAAGVIFTSSTAAGGSTTCSADLSGNRLVRMPKWTVTVGGEYALPLAGGEVALSADYYRSSSYFFDSANRLEEDGYSTVSAQIAFTPKNSKLRFRVFGSNLTDSTYYVQGSEQTLGDIISLGTPRTYGVGIDIRL